MVPAFCLIVIVVDIIQPEYKLPSESTCNPPQKGIYVLLMALKMIKG